MEPDLPAEATTSTHTVRHLWAGHRWAVLHHTLLAERHLEAASGRRRTLMLAALEAERRQIHMLWLGPADERQLPGGRVQEARHREQDGQEVEARHRAGGAEEERRLGQVIPMEGRRPGGQVVREEARRRIRMEMREHLVDEHLRRATQTAVPLG